MAFASLSLNSDCLLRMLAHHEASILGRDVAIGVTSFLRWLDSVYSGYLHGQPFCSGSVANSEMGDAFSGMRLEIWHSMHASWLDFMCLIRGTENIRGNSSISFEAYV